MIPDSSKLRPADFPFLVPVVQQPEGIFFPISPEITHTMEISIDTIVIAMPPDDCCDCFHGADDRHMSLLAQPYFRRLFLCFQLHLAGADSYTVLMRTVWAL